MSAKMTKNDRYCLFVISGGLGKHILATAVVKSIKKKYPKRDLIVVCGYPELFLNVKEVYRVFRHGMTPYFYNDYIKNNNTLIFANEPYHTTPHVNQQKRLLDTWCEMYGLKSSGCTPELVFNRRQIERSYELWNRERPVLILQTNGGAMEQPHNYAWTRDMPMKTAIDIVHAHKRDYHVIQICRNESQVLPIVDEAVYQPMSNMELLSCLIHSSKRILIDSCLQHASHALNMSSVVLWVGTSPTIFGYDTQTNVVADLKDVELPDSFMFEHDFVGHPYTYPQGVDEISFDLKDICPEYFDLSKKENEVQSTALKDGQKNTSNGGDGSDKEVVSRDNSKRQRNALREGESRT